MTKQKKQKAKQSSQDGTKKSEDDLVSPGVHSSDSAGKYNSNQTQNKKKLVETPAFGTKDKGFFRENPKR